MRGTAGPAPQEGGGAKDRPIRGSSLADRTARTDLRHPRVRNRLTIPHCRTE
ncbi:hypothetical protein L7750_14675 [Xenorhabdus bovienii]|uniref:hypothetical protein n=1 Tax=Xenorhabdus bovienii TaxID=40576 RepID=UPI001EDDEFAF|nr:hypothetical protein [Xenorhabdus bovienii]MCG3471597.1 hypothetical protein [Xenorhabdus bovienii]